uniref:Transglutaminase N-terminal domain-containing protein n=1 Tax=Astyanax mexicanus TaxID=7994 RepID=A0A8B9GXF1_ASTMX
TNQLSKENILELSSSNRKEHHTDQYHSSGLVVRRGQTFQIELDLSRPFNLNTDKLHLELKTGQCTKLTWLLKGNDDWHSDWFISHYGQNTPMIN